MNSFRLAVVSLALFAVQASAQPKTGELQPDRLAFGTVYTGATVEASFLLFEAGSRADVALTVTAPPFVKILKKSTRVQAFGPGNEFVLGDVELALDTSTPAEWKGDVTVTLGQTTAQVPVSAAVKERKAGQPRLLIAETPFGRYTTNDGRVFKAWTDLAKGASADVSYLLVHGGKPVLRDLDLRKFDAILLAGGGMFYLTPADVKKVREYAEGGRRVVVAANRFFMGTVGKANEVLAGYGLEMRDEEAPGGGPGPGDVIIGAGGLAPELVKAGVTSVRFFRGSPVAVTDGKKARSLVAAVGVGRPADGFVAVADAGKGKVVAISQSLWWHWVSEERAVGTDNGKLLHRLLIPPKGK